MHTPLARHLLPALFAAGFLVSAAFAQTTVTTDPVGFVTVTCLGNSDTFVSTPLHQAAVFQGAVDSVTGGNVLNIANAAFTADAYNGTHYVLVASGSKSGMWYAVSDTAANALTVDNAGDDISTALVGATVKVVPFWTLDTVMPNGQGVNQSTGFSGSTTSQVLIPNVTSAGINLATSAIYYYYSGAASGGEGWRKQGSPWTQKFDSQILLPDSFFIIRHNVAGNTEITNSGSVQMTQIATVIGTIAPNTAQDNAIAFNAATPMSLSNSNLYQSGAFLGNSAFTPKDSLIVFDNTVVGKNKSASAIYYYYTGAASGGAGWRKVGDPWTTKHDSTAVFQPGNGYMIRKAAAVTPASTTWIATPPYVAAP